MKKTKMLKKNYEFKQILSKGQYFYGKNIGAFIKKNNKDCNFLGLAISRKAGKAVNRNKIKRLLRENYKILEPKIKNGESIVFLLKKNVEIKKLNFKDIEEDMNKIFEKSNLFKVNKNKGI